MPLRTGRRMRDFQGMPGTAGGLALRVLQILFAMAVIYITVTTTSFSSFTALRCLVGAAITQSLWSLFSAFMDVNAVLIKRHVNPRVIYLYCIGDGFTNMLTYAAACGSAGLTILVSYDINRCSEINCRSLESATGMAIISWFAVLPSFVLSILSLISQLRKG